MSVLLHRRRATRTGPAAEFHADGGPTMSLARIAALPEPEWARPAYSSRHGLPLGWLRTVDTATVAATRATLDENLAAIADERARLGRHTVAMALAPVAELLNEPLPGTNWHLDLCAVLPPRVMPAPQETAMPDRQWFNDIADGERSAAPVDARQRNATRASWHGEVGAKNRPSAPIGRDPFHDPRNPRCVCTECSVAAMVACAPADDDEPWPFQYSRAQHNSTACARCDREFAVGELSYAIVTDESNEMFRHSLPEQCGPAVAPWSDDDEVAR